MVSLDSSPELEAWLEDRALIECQGVSSSMRARTELRLWNNALAGELARPAWTLAELGLLAALHRGTIPGPGLAYTVGFVAQAVADGTEGEEESWAEQHDVDLPGLLSRLCDLGPVADHALEHALVQWSKSKAAHTVDGWASVGVRVDPNTIATDVRAPNPQPDSRS